MNIYLCISCPKLLYRPYLLSMLRLECQSRETQVWLYTVREIWEKEKSTSGCLSEKEDYYMSASSFSYFIWNCLEVLSSELNHNINIKKNLIRNIDVSSVYLRLTCIHIEKPERINCLLLRNTPNYKAQKFIPSQRSSFNTEETLQKVQWWNIWGFFASLLRYQNYTG